MIWLALILLIGGLALLWMGNQALNEPGQSADVRIGGFIPLMLGGAAIVFAIIIGFLALVF